MAMAPFPRITRNDPADLAFAWVCLLSGAIGFDEFKAWAEHVVSATPADELPTYIFDIMMANESHEIAAHLPELVGFAPYDPAMTEGHRNAILGIAALRGTYRAEDAGMSQDTARATLAHHPQIAARFASTFPFLTMQEAC
jgi:hypothetical protein